MKQFQCEVKSSRLFVLCMAYTVFCNFEFCFEAFLRLMLKFFVVLVFDKFKFVVRLLFLDC